MARAELAAAELEVLERTTRAYYELAYAERVIEITQKQRELLSDLNKVAEAQYRASKVSQQDVLRAQVESANNDMELVRARQELSMAQAALARQLHVSPETPLATEGDVASAGVEHDLRELYDVALAARPELQAQLADIEQKRFRVDLARAQYVPDVTVAAEWGDMTTSRALSRDADGLDMVGVGLMVNMPIYRKRLEAGVRQAEAEVVASVREFDVKRDETLEEIRTLYVTARSQEELIALLDKEIIPKTDQAFRVSLRSYEVGQVDFLQLLDNRRQLLTVQLNRQRLATQLRQTVAALERAIGGYRATPIVQRLPAVERIENPMEQRP
jgi:outer membrane protein TolC